jgi:VWFA-related protein
MRGHTHSRGAASAAALAIAGLLAAGGPSSAQEPPTTPHTFFAPLDVPLVSVDAFVSDRDGRPVPGLGVEDFEILEDGRKVVISHFYAAPSVATAAAAAAPAAGAEAAARGPAQDLYLVIFFDDTNLARDRRQPALEHLRGFLGSELPPGLKVMLVRYDGGVRVEQVFTDDLEAVDRALDRVSDAASLSRTLDEDRLLREIEMAVTGASLGGLRAGDYLASSASTLLQNIDSYAEQTLQRVRASLADQTSFIRSLSGISGRKAILLVSDGVEARVGERLYSAWGAAFGSVAGFEVEAQMAFTRAARNDLGNDFDDLAREANAHRVSLYCLSDAGGARAQASSAEHRLMDEGGLTVQQAMSADALMSSLSATTGGRTLVNSPALSRQLDEVSEELASYYSLAFEPGHVGDGAYHRLEVRVTGKHLEVRHREGYLDVPASEQLENRTLAAAVHGVADNPLGISLEQGEILTREDGALLVPIIVMVPIGGLVLVPTADEHQGRISILLTVRDEAGGLAPPQLRQYPVPVRNLDLPIALTQSAGFTLRLAVSPGKQRIAVGVRDDVARTESVTTLEIDAVGGGG